MTKKKELYYLDDEMDLIPVSDDPQLSPILDKNATLPDRIEAFARLKYTKERIASALGYNKQEREIFFAKLEDETSEEHRAYQKGIVMGDAEIDLGLSKAAHNGDNFCAAELLKRQDHQRIGDLRKDLFNV
jgi:hypothetical protein